MHKADALKITVQFLRNLSGRFKSIHLSSVCSNRLFRGSWCIASKRRWLGPSCHWNGLLSLDSLASGSTPASGSASELIFQNPGQFLLCFLYRSCAREHVGDIRYCGEEFYARLTFPFFYFSLPREFNSALPIYNNYLSFQFGSCSTIFLSSK